MGGVVLVALFSQQDGASHHNNSTANISDTTTNGATKIHETPLGYVVGHVMSVNAFMSASCDFRHLKVHLHKHFLFIYTLYTITKVTRSKIKD